MLHVVTQKQKAHFLTHESQLLKKTKQNPKELTKVDNTVEEYELYLNKKLQNTTLIPEYAGFKQTIGKYVLGRLYPTLL